MHQRILVVGSVISAFTAPAWAQSDAEADAETPLPAAETRRPEALRAIVRGLFVEANVGGGYTIINADVEADRFNPGIKGSERLGAGTTVGLALGYDVNESVAVQLLTGSALLSGGRSDKVRDLNMIYGGAAVRVAVGLGDRVDFLVVPGVGYVNADNGVENADAGFGILARAGLEYYVHVRHFSVGLNLHVVAPVSPLRVFVAVTPSLKYTF